MMRLLLLALVLVTPAGMAGQAIPVSQQRNEADPSVPTIDINQARVEDFAKLPGIGQELARRIVTYREKHGPFRRIEDLLAIRGIGHKKWKAIRPYLKVGQGPGRDQGASGP
jgi:competence protein ComEA